MMKEMTAREISPLLPKPATRSKRAWSRVKSCLKGAPIPQRWVFALIGFSSILVAYAMRVCLSLAITEMVVSSEESDEVVDDTCPSTSNTTSSSSSGEALYEWSETLQGVILSSFYWGYVITHIPAGYLAERFGGKYTLSLGILSTAILTLLTPLAVDLGGSTALIALRILMGLGEGTTFPALNALIAQWTPPSERSKIGSLVFAGAQIGTVLANALTGLILASWNWRAVFYVFGGLGVLWFIFAAIFCYSTPDTHPFITEKEKKFLHDTMDEHTLRSNLPPIPWRHIMRSPPLWALVAAQVGHDWGLFTMVTDLPLYMSNVLKFSIKTNGYLTALPYLCMWLMSLVASWTADWLINTDNMSITNVRKLMTTIGSMGPAVFIVAASYTGCDRVPVVALFIIGMTLMGTYYPGMKVNSLDLSPNYSGTLMAIINGIGAITGIITPYLVGVLTPNSTLLEWRLVFWIVFVVFTVTNIIYLIYASGQVQEWNDPEFLRLDEEKRKNKAAGEAMPEPTKSID